MLHNDLITLSMRLLLLMILTCCLSCAGCSGRPQTVPLLPPDNLLQPCHSPAMPEALMQTTDLTAFAVAATRHIVDLHETVEACNARFSALYQWAEIARKEVSR